MAGNGAVSTPGEAARRLGIAGSTLRIYSVKLAELLSEGAGRPSGGASGRPGVRMYTLGDLRVLESAKELLGRGLTYEQVAEELRPRPRPADSGGGAVAKVRRPRAIGVADVMAVLDPLKMALERAMAATEAWQRLAEERQEEVDRLRRRIEVLEGDLSAARRQRAWWSRLLGGY